MTITEPVCFSCKHYNVNKNTCTAFPDGVPDDMLNGNLGDHNEKLEGQTGETVYKKGEPNWKD